MRKDLRKRHSGWHSELRETRGRNGIFKAEKATRVDEDEDSQPAGEGGYRRRLRPFHRRRFEAQISPRNQAHEIQLSNRYSHRQPRLPRNQLLTLSFFRARRVVYNRLLRYGIMHPLRLNQHEYLRSRLRSRRFVSLTVSLTGILVADANPLILMVDTTGIEPVTPTMSTYFSLSTPSDLCDFARQIRDVRKRCAQAFGSLNLERYSKRALRDFSTGWRAANFPACGRCRQTENRSNRHKANSEAASAAFVTVLLNSRACRVCRGARASRLVESPRAREIVSRGGVVEGGGTPPSKPNASLGEARRPAGPVSGA